ncbi:hypothetical protein ACA910_014800 [Epithemia clementina (nom. ined.)]
MVSPPQPSTTTQNDQNHENHNHTNHNHHHTTGHDPDFPWSFYCHTLARNDPCATLVNFNGHSSLGRWGADRLGHALTRNTHLVVLFLNQVQLVGSSPAWPALAQALAHHPTLEYLYLCHNPALGPTGIQVLAQALLQRRQEQKQEQVKQQQEQQQVTRRTTSDDHGRDDHHRRGLRVLKLAHCQMGNTGAVALAKWLSSSSSSSNRLQTLDLQHNDIGPTGFLILAKAFSSSSSSSQRLQTLDLRYNAPLEQALWRAAARQRPRHDRRRSPTFFPSSSSVLRDIIDQATSSSVHRVVMDQAWRQWALALAPEAGNNTSLTTLWLRTNNNDHDDDDNNNNDFNESIHHDPGTQSDLDYLEQEQQQQKVDLYLTLNRWGRAHFGRDDLTPWAWSHVLAKPTLAAKVRNNKNNHKNKNNSNHNNKNNKTLSLLYYLLRVRADLLSTTATTTHSHCVLPEQSAQQQPQKLVACEEEEAEEEEEEMLTTTTTLWGRRRRDNGSLGGASSSSLSSFSSLPKKSRRLVLNNDDDDDDDNNPDKLELVADEWSSTTGHPPHLPRPVTPPATRMHSDHDDTKNNNNNDNY